MIFYLYIVCQNSLSFVILITDPSEGGEQVIVRIFRIQETIDPLQVNSWMLE